MSLPQVVTTDENNSYRLSEVQVWIMPAVPADPLVGRSAGYTYPWDWALWKPERRLIPKKATRTIASMGSAEFQLLRTRRQDERSNAPQGGTDLVVEGSWIAISYLGQGNANALTSDPSDTVTDPLDPNADIPVPNPRKVLDPARVVWFGYIASIAGDQLKGTTEIIGNVAAREVGAMLDRQQIYGWQRSQDDSTGSYGDIITNPPTANLATGTSTIVGNAIIGKITSTSDDIYYFARLPAHCGILSANLWSRDRLLNHILKLCRPLGLPKLIRSDDQATIQAYLDDKTTPEVFELRGLTYKGALDLLASQNRGLGWYITADGPSTVSHQHQDGWTVHLFSYADSSTYDLPANVPINVHLGATDAGGFNQPMDSVSWTFSNEEVPDEVVIEGNPCVFAGTVSNADGNQDRGWTADQETSYCHGAKNNLNGSSNLTAYNALSLDDQKMLNAAVREQSSLRDVFTRFIIQSNPFRAIGDLTVANPPGLGGGAMVPLCPTLKWLGATNILQATSESSPPYLPAGRVLRCIPWPEGMKSTGEDTRDAKAKAAPQFLTVRIFRYDKTLPIQWRDQVAQNGRPALPSLSVEPDDHGLALRIRFSPPEVIAANHWPAGSAIADIDPAVTGGVPFDWKQLVVTLAVEGEQRVRVAKRRQVASGSSTRDLTDTEVRTRLVIPAPDLHCWVVAPRTILGLLATGKPDMMSADNLGLGYYATRNDFPVAERRARMAASFYFRQRAACVLSRARPDSLPVWAQLGFMVGSVRDTVGGGGGVAMPSNTVVTSVSFSFGDAPRVTVATDLPSLPSFPMLAGGGLGGGGPTSGGGVSTSLAGTTSQAVARVAGQGALAMDRDTQRVPIIVPRGGASVPDLVMIEIIDGQTVYNNGLGTIYYGIIPADVLSGVTTHYDPNVSITPGAFTAQNGIGRGFLRGDHSAVPVLVAHDVSQPIANVLAQTDKVQSARQATIQVGAGPDTITVYLLEFL